MKSIDITYFRDMPSFFALDGNYYVNAKDFADATGRNAESIRFDLRNNRIPGAKIGKRWFVTLNLISKHYIQPNHLAELQADRMEAPKLFEENPQNDVDSDEAELTNDDESTAKLLADI